jgi:hypothetical protein
VFDHRSPNPGRFKPADVTTSQSAADFDLVVVLRATGVKVRREKRRTPSRQP